MNMAPLAQPCAEVAVAGVSGGRGSWDRNNVNELSCVLTEAFQSSL